MLKIYIYHKPSPSYKFQFIAARKKILNFLVNRQKCYTSQKSHESIYILSYLSINLNEFRNIKPSFFLPSFLFFTACAPNIPISYPPLLLYTT